MPRGRPPKPEDERVRENPVVARHTLAWDGVTRGPDLPMNLSGIKWCTHTIAWYEVWRNSPQAMLFTDTDWMFLLDTALIHNLVWSPRKEAVTGRSGKITRRAVLPPITDIKTLMAELRQRTEHLGATVKDRDARGIVIKRSKSDAEIVEEAFSKDAKSLHNYVEDLTKEAARLRGDK